MSSSKMRRVDREHKCPGCHHDTWCLLGEKGYICMRLQSNMQKNFKGGEVGWFHYYDGERPQLPPPPKPVTTIDVNKLLKQWAVPHSKRELPDFAQLLGVSIESLEALEITRAPWRHAWGFPMSNGFGNHIGIRIRNEEGQKWSHPGSHAGIFIPRMAVPRRTLIVEGPTDAAAALTIGYHAIGRPSCSGGVEHIMTWVNRTNVREVVIISDNDVDKIDDKTGKFKPNPGITGALALQQRLAVPSCVLVLPTKDLREFISIGDKSTIDGMIDQLVWTQPRKAA